MSSPDEWGGNVLGFRIPLSRQGGFGWRTQNPASWSCGVKLLLENDVCVVNSGLRTHLDTEVVSIPIHAGGQPLQWAQEVPNLFPGWVLAVHNLEGL